MLYAKQGVIHLVLWHAAMFLVLSGASAGEAAQGNVIRSGQRFDLQAHRGGGGEVTPGNTLPAFEHAIDLRVTTLEMDVHLTKDGQIVVIHEDRLDSPWYFTSSAQKSAPNRTEIAALTLEQVRQFRQRLVIADGLSSRPSNGLFLGKSQYAVVPTLEEVFRLVKDYSESHAKSEEQRHHADAVRFCIELKAAGFERAFLELLAKCAVDGRVIVQSFNHDSLGLVSEINPAIPTMALSALPTDPERLWQSTKAKYWGPHWLALTRQKVRESHERGMLVVPWTVNDAAKMRRLIHWGVDGFMTDYPQIAEDVLKDEGIRY
jgi:glycerophosphoryl diester phosphodiesterase